MVAFYNKQDQNIYDNVSKFMPQSKYLRSAPTFTAPTTEEEVTETFGIPNTNAFTNSGGDNNFNSSFSNSPYTAQPSGNFVTNRTAYGTSGYLPGTEPEETFMDKTGGLLRTGIGMVIPGGNFLMGLADKYSRENRLNAQDNAFIDMQLANKEQNIHGFGNLTNQDRYGYNKDSLIGNYANVISDRVAIANERIAAGKELRDIDNYYLEKQKEEDDIKGQIDFNNFVKQRMTADNIRKQIKKGTINETFNIHTDPPGGGGKGYVQPPGTYDTDTSTGGSGDHRTSNSTTSSSNTNSPGHPSNRANGGRVGYFFGGRVNYKVGGRTDAGPNRTTASKAGVGQINESGQKVSGGNYNNGGDNQKPPESLVKNILDTGSELNYLNNLKNLNLPGLAVSFGVNKFRNYLENRKTKEEDDKLSYNTNSLPTNNYFAEVQQKDLDASKMKGFKQQDYPSYKDQMDMLNGGTKVTPYEFKGLQDGTITTTGTFTAANGGRAMFKNGGLASIL